MQFIQDKDSNQGVLFPQTLNQIIILQKDHYFAKKIPIIFAALAKLFENKLFSICKT